MAGWMKTSLSGADERFLHSQEVTESPPVLVPPNTTSQSPVTSIPSISTTSVPTPAPNPGISTTSVPTPDPIPGISTISAPTSDPYYIDIYPGPEIPSVKSHQSSLGPPHFPPVAQKFQAGSMTSMSTTGRPPTQGPAGDDSPLTRRKQTAVKGLSITVIILAVCSCTFEAVCIFTERSIDRPAPLPAAFVAPGIWVGIAGIVCGAVTISAAAVHRATKLVVATALSYMYIGLLFVQLASSSVLIYVLIDKCSTDGSWPNGEYWDTNIGYNCGDPLTDYVKYFQVVILSLSIVQGILMLFVTVILSAALCCPAPKNPPGYQETQYVSRAITITPTYPPSEQSFKTDSDHPQPTEISGNPEELDANIVHISERSRVALPPGKHIAKKSPKEFAKCAQLFGERTSKEQVRIISRYISNSSEAELNSVLSADEVDAYDQGSRSGTHLLIALKNKGVIFQASDDMWYYDRFVPVLEAVREFALINELLQEMSDSAAPVVSVGTSDEAQTKERLEQLAEMMQHAAEYAAIIRSTPLESSGAPLDDTRRVKTKRGTFVAKMYPQKFALFTVNFAGKVTREQLKKLAQYVFQLNQEAYDVQVLTADELSQFERGELDGGFFLEKLLGKGLIFEGSDGTYYYDGLAMILQETGEIELRNSMLDEKTNELDPDHQEGDKPLPADENTGSTGCDELDYYIAKEYPKKYAKFADNFRGMISLERLVKMADYIFRSGDKEFGRQLLSADERTQFQNGKRNGRHLVQKLKECGVIFCSSDGIFNYDGLARILEALHFHDIIFELLEKKFTAEATPITSPQGVHLLPNDAGDTEEGIIPKLAEMLHTSHIDHASWKTETLVARESPGNFGKFAENFRRWVTADEVVKLAHFIHDSRSEIGVQVLTADELTEFEAGDKGPGRLLTKLKDRGIIYSGSDDIYYYDGLAIILEQVEMHGLINQLLVKKCDALERIPSSLDPTGSDQKTTTSETDDQTVGDAEISRIPRTLIAKSSPRNFGLFVKDFADKVTQDQVVMLATYTYNSSETDFGLHVLGADELLEFERGEKKGQHFVAKLRDRGVVVMGTGHLIYYDGLAKILKEVGLHEIMEELLKRKSDTDTVDREDGPVDRTDDDDDDDAITSEVDAVPTAVAVTAEPLFTARISPKDFGLFTENFNRKVTKVGVQKLAHYAYHSGETEFQGKRVLTADEWEEFDSGKKEGAHLVTKLRDCGVIVSDSDGIYNYGGLARILRAVGLHHICNLLLLESESSELVTRVPDKIQPGESKELDVEPKDNGRWARLWKKFFGAGNNKKHADSTEKKRERRKWISSKLPQNFAAFCVRFNKEMTHDHLKEMAFYSFHAFENGAFPAPLISKDELTEFQNGKKSGMELLNILRKKQLIIRGDDAIFYYDGLVDVLETLENHELVASLFVKTASYDETNQAASGGQDDETVEVESDEQTGLAQTDTPDESGDTKPPIRDGNWVSAEDPTNFSAFCIWFNRQVTDIQVYEIVTYLFYAGEEEPASNQILTTEEMSDFKVGQRTAVDLLRVLKAKGIIAKGKDGVYFYDGLVAILNTLRMTDLVRSLLVEKENRVPEIELFGRTVAKD